MDPNWTDPAGQSALQVVVQKGRSSLAVLNVLLEAGADPDASHSVLPPLWEAVFRKNLPFVRRLLAAGADPNRATRAGVTPLTQAAIVWLNSRDLASERSMHGLVDVLLNAGADPNRSHPASGSALDAIAQDLLRETFKPTSYEHHRAERLIQRLTQAGARWDQASLPYEQAPIDRLAETPWAPWLTSVLAQADANRLQTVTPNVTCRPRASLRL